MKDFTISYPQGVKSFGNFMKVLTLFTVAALFQITQVQAQEPAQADQSVQKMLTSPGVYVGEGDPEAGWDPEAAAIKTSDFNMDARDFTTPLPNPDLSTNIACGDLRVTFVLDKSGSILTRNGVEQVRESTLALAQVFFGTDARVSVIEFDSQARVINLGGGAPVPSVGYVVDQTFLDNLETYLYDGDALGQFYDPQSPDNSDACPTGYTNWEDALLKSAPFDPNLVLFVTDGDPNTYNTGNACGYTTSFEPALEASIVAANALKTNGAHIFVVGVSNFINVANIPFIAGPDQFTPQFGDIFTDDFSTTSFENLTASLSEGINAICGTELSLTKTVDFDQVCDDETITFTITVENTGTTQIDAANVVITDEFPAAFANLTIVGAPVAGAEINGQTLTYEVGVLETGQSASIEIQANLPGANGIFLNTASADALNANSVQAEASVEKTDVVTSTLEVSACEEYEWNGEVYTVSDTYTFEGTNENGCPTLETLVLTINQPTSGTETVTACGSFEWNGTVYEESGSYPFTFQGEDGKCDSTATLNLTIEPAEIIVEYVTTCEFFYQNSFGDFYFESGIYTEEYDEGELCPTEYTLYLTIATTPQPGAEPQPCYPEGSQALTGTVDENCECQPNIFDCPELQANNGDICTDDTGAEGVIVDCECFVEPTFDCPELQANNGDACTDDAGAEGILVDCECFVEPTFDCPELEANNGDACTDDAGAEGVLVDCECFVEPDEEGCFGFEALVYEQGTGNIAPERADPTQALGAPERDDTINFVALGFGGKLILGFEEAAIALPGVNDLEVVETSFGNATCTSYEERADVYVSQQVVSDASEIDEDLFVYVGQSCTNGEFFDVFAETGFEYFTLVKIVDVSPVFPNRDGYDVDGIVALNGCGPVPTDECDVDGGVLTITGSNQVCVGTGEEVTFDNLSLTGAVGDNSIWVLTFGNLDVIATSATGPDFDLDGLTPAANYRIRHISYADGVDINQVLADPTTAGCWDRSKSIGIGLVGAPEAATISTNSLTTVCSGEGTPKFVVASATGGTAGASSVWVLTDDADDVIDYRFANSGFNLDALAAGDYKIYNVNWVTPFSPSGSAQNIADLGVCTGTSNAIEITVVDCTPGAAITSDPNPTAGASWVTFSVDKPQQVQVEVYDMAGRHISTVFKQNAAGGQDYRMQFDGTSLPNGVYMYRMTTESQVIIDKFMIAR